MNKPLLSKVRRLPFSPALFFCLWLGVEADRHPLRAATAIWTGGGATGTFTNTANWLSGTRPNDGDDLLFLGTAAQRTVTNVTFTSTSNYVLVAFAGSNYVIGNFEANRRVLGQVDMVAMGVLGTDVAGTNVFRESLQLANSNTVASFDVTATNGTLAFSNGLFLVNANKQLVKTGPGRVIVAGTGSLGNTPRSLAINGGSWLDYRTNNNALGTAVYLTNTAASTLLQVDKPDVFTATSTLHIYENGTLWTRPTILSIGLLGSGLTLRGGRWTNSGAAIRIPTNITTLASAQTAEIGIENGFAFSSLSDVVVSVANGSAPTDALIHGFVNLTSGDLTKTGAGTLVMPLGLNGNLELNQGTLRISNLVATTVNIASNTTASITNLNATTLHNRGATTVGSNSFAGQVIAEGGTLNGGPLRVGTRIVGMGASNHIAASITLTANIGVGFSNTTGGSLVLSGNVITTNRILLLTNLAAKQAVVLAGNVFGSAGAIAAAYDVLVTNGECRVTGTNQAATVIQASGAGAILSGSGRLKHARVLNGALLAPGPNIATLHADGDVVLDDDLVTAVPGRLEMDLDSPNDYDKLILSSGTFRVHSTGTAAQLSVSKAPGFLAASGTVLKIVELPNTTSPSAPFAGWPEGTVTNLGGTSFRISYTGGDGNDITLTVVGPPPNPRFSTPTRNGTNLTFGLTNTVGAVNYLESLSVLAEPYKWQRVATNNTPASGLTNFVVPIAGGTPTRFYRIGSP